MILVVCIFVICFLFDFFSLPYFAGASYHEFWPKEEYLGALEGFELKKDVKRFELSRQKIKCMPNGHYGKFNDHWKSQKLELIFWNEIQSFYTKQTAICYLKLKRPYSLVQTAVSDI